jgi:hypothetical protein
MRFEEEQLRRLDGLNARKPRRLRAHGPFDSEERGRVVGVEGARSVRDDDVGSERADAIGDRDERVAVDLEGIVAEIEH